MSSVNVTSHSFLRTFFPHLNGNLDVRHDLLFCYSRIIPEFLFSYRLPSFCYMAHGANLLQWWCSIWVNTGIVPDVRRRSVHWLNSQDQQHVFCLQCWQEGKMLWVKQEQGLALNRVRHLIFTFRYAKCVWCFFFFFNAMGCIRNFK